MTLARDKITSQDLNMLDRCLALIKEYEEQERQSSSKNLRTDLKRLRKAVIAQYFSVIKGAVLNTDCLIDHSPQGSTQSYINAGNSLLRVAHKKSDSERGRALLELIKGTLQQKDLQKAQAKDKDDSKQTSKQPIKIEGEITNSSEDEDDIVVSTKQTKSKIPAENSSILVPENDSDDREDDQNDATGVNISEGKGIKKRNPVESKNTKLNTDEIDGPVSASKQTKKDAEKNSEKETSLKSDQEIQIIFSNLFMLQIRACFDSLNKKHDFSFMENKLHAAVYAELERRFTEISTAFNNKQNTTFDFQNLREQAYQAIIDSFDLFGLLPYSLSDSTVQACLKQFLFLMSHTIDQGPFETANDHYKHLLHQIKRPTKKNSDTNNASESHQNPEEGNEEEEAKTVSSETRVLQGTKKSHKKDDILAQQKQDPSQDPMIDADAEEEDINSPKDKPKEKQSTTATQTKLTIQELKTKFYGVVANMFRLYDWYADNDMGWELASELGIKRNDKQGRLESLQHLRDQVTVIYNELKEEIAARKADPAQLAKEPTWTAYLNTLKTKIHTTATEIQETFGGKNSRIANGLADLFAILNNSDAGVIPAKYDLPQGILKTEKGKKERKPDGATHQTIELDFPLEESQRYINRHFLVQSRRAVTDYIQEGYSRNIRTWDAEKKEAALTQNREFFQKQRITEDLTDQPTTPVISVAPSSTSSSSTASTSQASKVASSIASTATHASATSPKVALGFLDNILAFIRNIMKPKADPNGAVTKNSNFFKHSFFKMTQEVERIVNPKIKKQGNPAGQRTTGTPRNSKNGYTYYK